MNERVYIFLFLFYKTHKRQSYFELNEKNRKHKTSFYHHQYYKRDNFFDN